MKWFTFTQAKRASTSAQQRQKNRARMQVSGPQVQWSLWVKPSVKALGWLILGIFTLTVINRPITRVTVVGPFQRVSAIDVEQLVRSRLNGGFLTANLWELQRDLEQVPWVASARLERRWPHTLVVVVGEQQSIAAWADSGLLNSRGEIFVKDIKYAPADLPKLHGPDGTEHEVTQLFLQLQPRLIEMGYSIASLNEDERGSWQMTLTNGINIRFGRRQLQERLERFVRIGAPVLTGRTNDIAFIDMRYSNGFSVGWRTQSQSKAEAQASSTSTSVKRDQHG
jgi:cell division protein FtsQ